MILPGQRASSRQAANMRPRSSWHVVKAISSNTHRGIQCACLVRIVAIRFRQSSSLDRLLIAEVSHTATCIGWLPPARKVRRCKSPSSAPASPLGRLVPCPGSATWTRLSFRWRASPSRGLSPQGASAPDSLHAGGADSIRGLFCLHSSGNCARIFAATLTLSAFAESHPPEPAPSLRAPRMCAPALIFLSRVRLSLDDFCQTGVIPKR